MGALTTYYVDSAELLCDLVDEICPDAEHTALGSESRLGVSEDPVGLRMTGIYPVSRNSMYLGFHLVTLASLVSVLHPVNIGCGLVGVYVHHRFVLAEDRFLLKVYGASY